MKIEIEITEAEIADAIRRKARIAIAEYTEQVWYRDEEARKKIKQFWNTTVDTIIQEEMANSPAIRAKVTKLIEAKMRAQVAAWMRGEK